MPQLIKDISGEILSFPVGEIKFLNNINGEIKFEDYIYLNGFIAYLQNFSKVEKISDIELPIPFGLKNQYNKPIIQLEISY